MPTVTVPKRRKAVKESDSSSVYWKIGQPPKNKERQKLTRNTDDRRGSS